MGRSTAFIPRVRNRISNLPNRKLPTLTRLSERAKDTYRHLEATPEEAPLNREVLDGELTLRDARAQRLTGSACSLALDASRISGI